MDRRDKVKLSRIKKIVLMAAGIVVVVVLSAIAIYELSSVRYNESDIVRYSYKSKAEIDYKVHLRHNIMFDERVLEDGRYYVLKYIENVDVELEYDFSSDSAAGLETEYSVIAHLQGLHGSENEILWSKEFVFVPEKMYKEERSGLNIKENVDIGLSKYSSLVQNIYLDSEVNAPVILNVVFNIHTVASTEYGVLEDNLSTNIVIPIGNSVFKIEGKPTATGEKRISEKVQSRIPTDIRKVVLFFIGAFILLIAVIFILRLEEAPVPDDFEKLIAAIFKEYSERLAGLEHTIAYHFSDNINVNCIEDMVKIADEVGQPVFYYKVDSDVERKIEFFVFDNMHTYYHVIFGEINANI
jgi:hypothetical protein